MTETIFRGRLEADLGHALRVIESEEPEPSPARRALADHLELRARLNRQSAALSESIANVQALRRKLTEAETALAELEAHVNAEVRQWAQTGGVGQAPSAAYTSELQDAHNRVAAARLEVATTAPVIAEFERQIANLQPARERATERLAELVLNVALAEAESLARELHAAEVNAAAIRAKLIGLRKAVARPVVGPLQLHTQAFHRVQKHLETEPPQPRDADIERASAATERWLRSLPADAAAAIELED